MSDPRPIQETASAELTESYMRAVVLEAFVESELRRLEYRLVRWVAMLPDQLPEPAHRGDLAKRELASVELRSPTLPLGS